VFFTFWRLSRIFTVLLLRCNLCAEIALTSMMHFLYLFHHWFYYFLWYYAIAMLLLVKVMMKKRVHHLHLDCIFAFFQMMIFRSIVFLKMNKREMIRLILISWTCISLHACLIFCVQSIIQLYSVTLFCSIFKWICSELVYVSIFKVSMLVLLKASATWCKAWFWSISSLHSLSDSSSFLSRWCQTDASNAISDLIIIK